MNKQKKPNKHKLLNRQYYGGRQREGGELVKGKEGQIYGDRRFDFGW